MKYTYSVGANGRSPLPVYLIESQTAIALYFLGVYYKRALATELGSSATNTTSILNVVTHPNNANYCSGFDRLRTTNYELRIGAK